MWEWTQPGPSLSGTSREGTLSTLWSFASRLSPWTESFGRQELGDIYASLVPTPRLGVKQASGMGTGGHTHVRHEIREVPRAIYPQVASPTLPQVPSYPVAMGSETPAGNPLQAWVFCSE